MPASTIRTALVATIVFGLVAVADRTAEAKCSATKEVPAGAGKTKKVPRVGKPEKTFGGKVLTSNKRFPTYARSERAYIAKVRKQVVKKFWENKKEKSWKIYFIAFFKRPVDDMEVSIKLWNVTSGTRHMMSSFEQYIERCDTSYASSMVLKREDFGVNKDILITIEVKHHVVASGKIKIQGEAEHYTGKVTFTDDDDDSGKASGDDDDDDDDVDPHATSTANNLPPEPPPEKDPEALDMNDKSLDAPPTLDPEVGLPKEPPKTQKSQHGCGCSTGAGSPAGPGALLLLAVVWGVLRRRPGTRS